MGILVSCIMPTRGRREMAREALGCFLAQTYSPRELVIVDDIQDPSFDASVCTVPGVRWMPLIGHKTIGSKRNIACDQAKGDIVAHWDSDDLSAPGRLTDQVERLIKSGLDVSGYNEVEFFSAGGRWIYRNPTWAVGSSLVYWRRFWHVNRFEPVMVGEDNAFIAHTNVANAPSRGLLVARIHAGQTNRTAEKISQNDNNLWTRVA